MPPGLFHFTAPGLVTPAEYFDPEHGRKLINYP
jgi:hypothetical protein